jgi:hypothetical protein
MQCTCYFLAVHDPFGTFLAVHDPFGTFAYRRMPFGLCNAPVTF